MVRISENIVEQFINSYAAPLKELIQNYDATDDPLHSNQEGRFFHGYYDRYCYLPLYVFCGDHFLVAYLRESGIDTAKHSRAFLKLLVEKFREAWTRSALSYAGIWDSAAVASCGGASATEWTKA